MNILIEMSPINRGSGGNYQYAIGLLNVLGKAGLPHRFYVYNLTPDDELRAIVARYPNFVLLSEAPPRSWRLVRRGIWIVGRLLKELSGKEWISPPHPLQYLLSTYRIDLVHTSYQDLLRTSSVPGISTMHDVQELHFPEFFTSAQRAYRAAAYKRAIDDADAVIVSYEHVRKDIIRYFAKSPEQVHVVLLDMQDLWFERFGPKDVITGICERFEIPGEFLLYPAATWAHKNHLALLEAIASLRDAKGRLVHLVCTGQQSEHFEEIRRRIAELNLERQARFLGIVSDVELFSLYHRCRGVVVPTLYEAGSFPLMESLLLGVPVICSDATSLPETIGDAQYVFSRQDTAEMADKIERLYFDPEYRARNIEHGRTRAALLRDNQAARKIDAIYSRLVGLRR